LGTQFKTQQGASEAEGANTHTPEASSLKKILGRDSSIKAAAQGVAVRSKKGEGVTSQGKTIFSRNYNRATPKGLRGDGAAARLETGMERRGR